LAYLLPQHVINKEGSFANGSKERDIRRHLLLEGRRTLSEAVEMKASDIAAGMPSRFHQMNPGTFWRSCPDEQEETTDIRSAGAVARSLVTAHLEGKGSTTTNDQIARESPQRIEGSGREPSFHMCKAEDFVC
jgi:hypothetical protein